MAPKFHPARAVALTRKPFSFFGLACWNTAGRFSVWESKIAFFPFEFFLVVYPRNTPVGGLDDCVVVLTLRPPQEGF